MKDKIGLDSEVARVLKENNFFRILDLDYSASSEDVRAAYKRLVKRVHPDRFPEPVEKHNAEQAFKRLGVAMETLKDPFARKDYERTLGHHSESPKRSAPSPASDLKKETSSTSSRSESPPRTNASPPPRPESSPRTNASTSPRPESASSRPHVSSEPSRKATQPLEVDLKKREKMRQEQSEKHFQQGVAHERKNALDDAIKEYQEAIRIYHDTAKFHSHLGLCLQKKGWAGYAQAEFKVALHFDPTDRLALKHYQPTSAQSSQKGTGFKLLNLFRQEGKIQRLGDILIDLGHLNKDQLKSALKQQHDEKLLLGEILIRMQYIKPEHLAQALIHQGENAQKAVSS